MMTAPTMTYALAMAAAHDAGNRSMKAGRRTVWALKDYNAACAEFERLYGAGMYSADIRPQEDTCAAN